MAFLMPHWQPSPEKTSLSSKRLPAGANLKTEGAASIGRNRENNVSTQQEQQQKAYVVCVHACMCCFSIYHVKLHKGHQLPQFVEQIHMCTVFPLVLVNLKLESS